MVYSRMISIAYLYPLFLATIRLCSAIPDDPNATPAPSPFPTGEADNPHVAAIAEYGLTFECYERDDGLGMCFEKQCQEACGVADDRIPQGCVQDGVSPKLKREDEMAVRSSVSCMIDKPWQSLDGSGEPNRGHCRCNDAAIAIIGDFFVDSVQKIGEIMEKFVCPGLLALDIVINAGISAIPGVGQAITAGMKVSIQVAKAVKVAYEGMDAASAFADIMIGGVVPSLAQAAGCKIGIPSRTDLMKKAYPPLSDVPDSVVPGVNPDDLPCGRGGGRKKPNGKCEREDGDSGPSNGPNSLPQNTQKTPSQTNAPSETNSPSPTGSQGSPSNSAQSLSSANSNSDSKPGSITTTDSISSSTVSACRRRTRTRQHPIMQRAFTDTPEPLSATSFVTSLAVSRS
ncbi:hypothetical protein K469DRAFT_810125 [Zopfia rhizophila CBS 207.26]|uniref:Uncharacterized protein n=1 Tax=Zopfia rhizophila CBS 207.26 TaxID=1314779 RepID=A0A6A6DDI2_9PEZI|nr:hypothetical protein K469DRAFT_810125 [Zopfia rhizophila CBS 207.26]